MGMDEILEIWNLVHERKEEINSRGKKGGRRNSEKMEERREEIIRKEGRKA